MTSNKNNLKVGNKVKFPEFNYFWKVRAIDDRYAICTAYGCYTILDFKNSIRGSGTSWGLSHKTDEQIAESMLALNNQHPDGVSQEVSARNCVPLVVTEIK
ncbi:hypothetical protein [Acinetobacter pollinis]|uniref:Uncharacterized protein n=1 Tax=Acinetobacter pollinis TaxID=2605270 RepID=A0ABU6DNT1_9GAMM|nr:hypothetical protein [Acinetobacter pollinis]MEB5475520.1 hypothetical protein [Acinetobacter pollinis]